MRSARSVAGQEVVEFACGIPHLLKGGFSESVSTKVDVYSIRQPLGVVGIISPFNFPAMVPMWFFPIAIAAGNTVIVKPSEKDPSATNFIAELWAEAGLPAGVFNVVHGDKVAVDRLLDAPGRQVAVVRRVNPDRQVRVRDGHGTRQARAGARWRQEPHAGAARRRPRPRGGPGDQRRASALPGSAAWRSRRCSPSDTVGRPARSRRSRSGWPPCAPVTVARGSDMGPLVTAQHRDKVVGIRRAGRGRRRNPRGRRSRRRA